MEEDKIQDIKDKIITESFTVESYADGLPLSVLITLPVSNAKGIVQFAHGMSEHKMRYLNVMKFLSSHGYICGIHDHRGHGKSVHAEKDLGYFYKNGSKAIVEDQHQIISLVRARFPDLPLYLFGHSMGSLVARSYIKKYDDSIDGLILCGSPSNQKAASAGLQFIKTLIKSKGDYYRSPLVDRVTHGFKRNGMDMPPSRHWISTDSEMVAKFDQDPLCGFIFTLNGFEALLTLFLDVYGQDGWQLKKPHLPVWFISGEKDIWLVNEKRFLSAVNFLQNRGYENISYKLYPDMKHEILNEIDRQTVYDDILQKINGWL